MGRQTCVSAGNPTAGGRASPRENAMFGVAPRHGAANVMFCGGHPRRSKLAGRGNAASGNVGALESWFPRFFDVRIARHRLTPHQKPRAEAGGTDQLYRDSKIVIQNHPKLIGIILAQNKLLPSEQHQNCPPKRRNLDQKSERQNRRLPRDAKKKQVPCIHGILSQFSTARSISGVRTGGRSLIK